jgi:hypothetical protein
MARTRNESAQVVSGNSRRTPPGATRLGWPRPARVHEFAQLLQQPQASRAGHRFEFQGRLQILSVLTVPIDLPKYRLENGRTCSLQTEYLAVTPTARPDLFTGDPEMEDAQEVQHQLLVSLADVSNLRDFFAEPSQKQVEPLILDEDGFVVNGNRRLATWRELLQSDPGVYGHFRNIEVVVLPHCDPRDIDRLEARLQIAKEIRADYTWDALASMMRRHQERNGMSHAELAELYDMPEADVRETLDMLSYAEEYLQSRGKPRKWSEVSGDKYAFSTLVSSRERVSGVGKKELLKQSVFTLIDNPDQAGGRLYAAVKDIAEHIDVVHDRLQSHFNVAVPAPVAGVADLFGGVSPAAGPETSDVRAIALAAHIQQPTNAEQARQVIVDAIESQRQLRKDARTASFLLTSCSKAHSTLAEAVRVALRPETSKAGVENQLQQIEALLATIRTFVNSDAAS